MPCSPLHRSRHPGRSTAGSAGPTRPRSPESSGAYPFLFDALDAACHAVEFALRGRSIRSPRSPTTSRSTRTPSRYDATQTSDTWHTSESFIPSGLLGPGNEVKAEAAFNGHVICVERRTNRLTGIEFIWCLVRSTGGTFDVVADPEVLPGHPPVGGVISGSYWLSGRIGACEAPSTTIQASDTWKRRAALERR